MALGLTYAFSLPQVVLSRQYGSEGRFTFTSHTPGDHQICLHSNSTRMALFAGGRLVRPSWALGLSLSLSLMTLGFTASLTRDT